jgi:hypothetical protein
MPARSTRRAVTSRDAPTLRAIPASPAPDRLYAVAVVRADLSERPLIGLRSRAYVDLLLAKGIALRVQLAERV